jgi:hypothetical protein
MSSVRRRFSALTYTDPVTTERSGDRTTKRSGARLWLLAFTGFFLLFTAWGVATPYDGPPDEKAHALRAAAVGNGDLLPTDGYFLQTPRSLVRVSCFPMQVTVPADCTQRPGGDDTLSLHKVGAASYNPVYYAVTGWPVAVWPNWTGILLARIFTGAVMAALLASAVVGACRWFRNRAVLAGILVATTPMIAHLGGSINPNGVEIAAGLALFVGLIALLREQETLNRGAATLVGISGAVLATPRSIGIVWLGLIFLTVLIGTPRARIQALLRERLVRIWFAVISLSVVAAVAWTIIARNVSNPQGDMGITWKEVLRFAVLDMWPNVANQLVGVMGWAETLQPRLVYVAWFMAVGLLVLGGFTLGRRIDKIQLLFLFFGTFAPLITLEVLQANQWGWYNQGRYFLPGAVGLPILGAYILAENGVTAEKFRSIIRSLALVLIPIQLVCLAYTMTRWQSGLEILNPLKGSWLPPLGPELPLVLGALSVVLLFVLYWWASRITKPSPDAPLESGAATEDVPRGVLTATG